MRRFAPTTSCLLALFLITASPSCSALHRMAGGESAAVERAIKQAQAHFALGDYQKALGVYADAYADHPRSAPLRAQYIKAGEQIKVAADNAFQRQAFAEAGSSYTLLLKNTITAQDFSRELSFDGDYLDRRIKACSKGLLEAGLVHYRQGRLDEAISIWRKVVTFDPDNRDVKDAIATAAVQLQNLKNMR